MAQEAEAAVGYSDPQGSHQLGAEVSQIPPLGLQKPWGTLYFILGFLLLFSFIFTIQVQEEGSGRELPGFWLTHQVGVGESYEEGWAPVFGIHTVLRVISPGVSFPCFRPPTSLHSGAVPQEAESSRHTGRSVPVL